jgi:hypothetical protein
MKKLTPLYLAAVIPAAFTTGLVSAAGTNVHGGFASGNSDLYPSAEESMVTSSAPGMGDSYNPYQGDWVIGNADLFISRRGQAGHSSGFPNIYHGFGKHNPDL